MTLDLTDALTQIITGLKLIGNGVTYLITLILERFGLPVSAEVVKITAVLVVSFLAWKFSTKVSKLVLFIFLLFIIVESASFF